MSRESKRGRARSTVVLIGAVALIGLILWLDFTTGIWNDLVVVAGLAAGLVTSLLTALVLERIVARSEERKWAPVTRLALTEFLHMIADEKRSEISRGLIVPRTFPSVDRGASEATVAGEATVEGAPDVAEQLHTLRHHVVAERRHLTQALGRWVEFLSSSSDNEDVLRHIAEISVQLDRIRDSALEAEEVMDDASFARLEAETKRGNELTLALEAELRALIANEDRLAARASTSKRPSSDSE